MKLENFSENSTDKRDKDLIHRHYRWDESVARNIHKKDTVVVESPKDVSTRS